MLDAEELFHLGIKAGSEGDSDKAIRYFKESIELAPTAETIYLLAAEYANLNMYERAIAFMQEAVDLKPDLYTAYIQLCLLHLMTNNGEGASNSLKGLQDLPEESYLKQFGVGLQALIEDDVELALSSLARGIEINEENPALNGDMQKIIDNLSNIEKPGDKGEDVKADQDLTDKAGDYLLSNYQKNH